MTDSKIREKLLTGLTIHAEQKAMSCRRCPYERDERCTASMAADAVYLATPRVLTYEEICDLDDGEVVWTESIWTDEDTGLTRELTPAMKDSGMLIDAVVQTRIAPDMFRIDDMTIRFWSKKPTPEMMREADE
jgi:hypothetical protein